MSVKELIHQTIAEKFAPKQLEVVDESAQHAGHMGARPGGESHFFIRISSAPFTEMNRIEREKILKKTIDNATDHEIHALRFQFI